MLHVPHLHAITLQVVPVRKVPLTAPPPQAGAGSLCVVASTWCWRGSSRARHREVRAGAGSFQRQGVHQCELWNFLEMVLTAHPDAPA